jgi:PTH1 family peptidyl-tRNA hydrolase
MILMAGLGNPGAKFKNNRHNIGFMAAEAIHRRHRFAPWRQRFQGLTAEGVIGMHKVLLLMPGTYMNESGRAVGEAMRFFKIELGQVVVFHDELDLPPARLRVKTGGGNAGHNGLRSITAQCGNDYRRARMGIGHPGDKNLVHTYVLNDFAKAEMPWVEDLCAACADHAELLAAGDDPLFQNRIHLAMEGRGWGEVKRPGEAGSAPKA